MTYIRTKNINNNNYAYLVENVKTDNGPRQKVLQYLGRVHQLEKKDVVEVNQFCLLNNLVVSELKARGFKQKDELLINKKMSYSPKSFVLTKKTNSKTEKDAVLKVNDGHLCSFTLQRIANFKKSKNLNADAQKLAKYFLEAGLQVSREQFVQYYQRL